MPFIKLFLFLIIIASFLVQLRFRLVVSDPFHFETVHVRKEVTVVGLCHFMWKFSEYLNFIFLGDNESAFILGIL